MYYSRKQPDKAQDMNQTATAVSPDKKIMVDTAHLMALLDCGKHTSIRIGHEASACVRLDRKLFWNVRLIQKHIDNISE